MKKLLMITILLFSFSSYACDHLSDDEMKSCLNDRIEIAERYSCFELHTDSILGYDRPDSYYQEMYENNSLSEFSSCSDQVIEESELNDRYYSERSEIVADLKFEN